MINVKMVLIYTFHSYVFFISCTTVFSVNYHQTGLTSFVDQLAGNTSKEKISTLAGDACPFLNFCTREQKINSSLYHFSSLVKPCCTTCSCQPTCRFYRSCCFDAQWSTEGYHEELFNHMSCDGVFLQTKYRLENAKRIKDIKYTMVNSCPGADGKLPCIKVSNNSRTSTDVINDNILVSSKDGRIIFKNEFCAKCHNVTDYTRWVPSVARCKDDLFKLKLSRSALSDYVLEHCIVFSEPPDEFETDEFLCTEGSKNLFVSRCNVTEQWDEFDSEIFKMCMSSQHTPVYQSKYEVYSNVFCMLCNSPGDKIFRSTCQQPGDLIISLGYILNLELSTSSTVDLDKNDPLMYSCQDDEILDPYFNVCRHLECPFQRIPKYGRCHDHLFEGKDVYFGLSFKLSFGENTTLDNHHSQNILDVENFLDQLNISTCNYMLADTTIYFTKTLKYLMFVSMEVYVRKTAMCAKNVLNYLLSKSYASGYIQVTLFEQIFNCTAEFYVPVPTSISNGSTYGSIPLVDKYDTETHWILKSLEPFYKGSSEGMPCPHIILDQVDYLSHVLNKTFHLDESFYANMLSRIIERIYYVGQNREFLYFICLDDYIPTKHVQKDIPRLDKITFNTKGLLTFILACFSLISLFLCIVLFCVSRKLQSVPSKVFLIALINLFIAQGLFHFGVDQVDFPYFYCAFIGSFVHFAWLSAVFALNAYCVLVATKISSLRNLKLSNLNEIMKSVAYIYGLPCFFVTVNILYTWLRSGHIGYGQYLCYIDLPLMRAICFALPIFLTVVINCCVNTYIILKTRQSAISAGRRLQETRNAAIYFRLMLLTGIAWLFGFLNEIYSSIFLEYCFIISVTGQGIFLLIMFHVDKITQGFRKLVKSKSLSQEMSTEGKLDRTRL